MRRIILLACLLLSLGIALSAAGFALASRSAGHAEAIDPRLILHPHTVTTATLAPGFGTIRLNVYPAIPGTQRVALLLPASLHPASVVLRAEMAGMMMAPSEGKVVRSGSSYRGRLDLPMFGSYRVQVRLPHRGSVVLDVFLPLPAGR